MLTDKGNVLWNKEVSIFKVYIARELVNVDAPDACSTSMSDAPILTGHKFEGCHPLCL